MPDCELRRDELLARIAAGLAQFILNILQRVDARAFFGELIDLDGVGQGRFSDEIGDGDVERFGNAFEQPDRIRGGRR